MRSSPDGADAMTPDEARALAALLHADQRDKAGEPYADHVCRVGDRVRAELPYRDDVAIAAYLHDAIEDTAETAETLRARGVPDRSVRLIALLTRDADVPYASYLAAIASDLDAIAIKVADIRDNSDPDRVAALDRTTREALARKYDHALTLLDEFSRNRWLDDYDRSPRDAAVTAGVSWLIASRLLGYGRNLKANIDLTAGGGLYDVLQISDAKNPSRYFIALNRNGSIHVGEPGVDPLWWPQHPGEAGRVAEAIADRVGLPAPSDARTKRPAEHIAELIGRAILAQCPTLSCRPANSGWSTVEADGPFDRTLFAHYPGAQRRLAVQPQLNYGDAASRFFFLTHTTDTTDSGTDEAPVMAFEMTGYAWLPDEERAIATPGDWPDCDAELRRRLGIA